MLETWMAGLIAVVLTLGGAAALGLYLKPDPKRVNKVARVVYHAGAGVGFGMSVGFVLSALLQILPSSDAIEGGFIVGLVVGLTYSLLTKDAPE